jgi:uncharacterized protein YbcI
LTDPPRAGHYCVRMATHDEYLSEAGRADAASDAPSSLLSQISNEMVRAQKTYFGRGPVRAKSYLLDDFLLIVMRGGLLPVERTMLDAGKQDTVRQYRQDFENEMTVRLVGKMEQLTGRKILTYQSQILFNPDIVVEIFFFDDSASSAQVLDTVKGQLEDPRRGEATAFGDA